MRIDATNVNTPPPPVSVPDGGSKVSAAKVPAGDGGGADALGGFSPTPDLAKLLALVKEVPEVRGELVQEVLERASVGELNTRTAATDTASAMLDAG
jgi:hypothetical protein